MTNKEELYPKDKRYSLIVIDLWDDEESSAYKILETDELEQTVKDIRKVLNVGEYLMVYNQKGETVEI